MLIDHGSNVHEKDNKGDEPLHSAAKSKNCNSVYILKEAGANMCSKGTYDENTIPMQVEFKVTKTQSKPL